MVKDMFWGMNPDFFDRTRHISRMANILCQNALFYSIISFLLIINLSLNQIAYKLIYKFN